MKRVGLLLPAVVALTYLGAAHAGAQEKRLDPGALETLMAKLGLDEAQKGKLRAIHKEFDKKLSATSSALGIWGAYHREDLVLQKMLTDKQQHRQAEVLTAMRVKELKAVATTLGLSDEQRQRIAELRDAYEPKFIKLVAPTQKGQKLSDEDRMATHKLVIAMRADFLKAVRAELTEAQRQRLPVILKQSPGLPGYIPEGDALAYVLLAATLAHYAQAEFLDTLALTLGLSDAQKEEFRKVGANLDAKLKAARAQVAAAVSNLARMEREAMEKVLTDEQRTRWKELQKVTSESK
jgi:hypothetical protein